MTTIAIVMAGMLFFAGCGGAMDHDEMESTHPEGLEAMQALGARHLAEVEGAASTGEATRAIEDHARRMNELHAAMVKGMERMPGCGGHHGSGEEPVHGAAAMMEAMRAGIAAYAEDHAGHTELEDCRAAAAEQIAAEREVAAEMAGMRQGMRCGSGMHGG